ncbi:uncharacterized protein LOC141699793 [Apium graveolens]|uniref:uncharacterized protein LOC141699793 n=1 Tax=Apium graveolens TaxID=4045 RepID=UPI003D7A321F
MPSSATIVNDSEKGDCVQKQSSSTSGVRSNTTTSEVTGAPRNATTAQTSRKQPGKRKRSCGRTSLAKGDGQPSSEANVNPPRSRRTISTRFGEDDMTTADRAISDSQLVGGTADVPLPSTGRGQGRRSISRRNTRSSRTYDTPGSSSERADEEPDIEPGSSDTRVAEDDLTPTERRIPDTQLLRNLGKHPSVYARAGQNPPTKGLYFRGAWRNAVKLYRAANDQYKQLFIDAGFGDFLQIEPVDLPQGYLIALTERWFAETNTLHLPCCELGPTPLDWTMITGLRFGGQPIELDTEYDKKKVRRLLGLRREDLFSGNRLCLNNIIPSKDEVMAVPPTREAMEGIFRRLFLYVIGSCFFGNSRSVMHFELLQFLEDIDAVKNYDWGAITYAAFLSGMRKKVTGRIGAFTAFWQFLLFWAFEYLSISRPEHSEEGEKAFPRAMRWKFAKNIGTLDNSELTASRCQLDDVDDVAQVTWEPYVEVEIYDGIGSSIDLAKNRVRFMSLDTWEYYLGERCRRQLGLSCLVPQNPPKKMYGQQNKKKRQSKDEQQSKNEPANHINSGRSAATLVRNDIKDYASWFANNSVGKIVDVNQLIGGPDIGRKVMSHWMATHQPEMILVPESEVKEITEALGTADAELNKLQEELSQIRRGSYS